MGGFQSKYNATNFETAKGNCTKTIMGDAPVTTLANFSIVKQSAMNKREFFVSDGTKSLFSTKAVANTARWFDLVDAQGKAVIRLGRTHMFNITWDLYQIDAPVWEGQQADEKMTAKSTDDVKLYRLGQLKMSAMGQNHGQFYLYAEGDDKQGVLDTTTSLLRLEKIRSFSQKWQTMNPDNTYSLVGYWEWNGHSMNLHLAAGTDVALHAAAAIVMDLIHLDQVGGAGGAGAGAGAF